MEPAHALRRPLAAGAHLPEGGALGAARLAALLAEMVDRGCKGAVVEVSGSALENRSFEGMAFDAAVVTEYRRSGWIFARDTDFRSAGPKPSCSASSFPAGWRS